MGLVVFDYDGKSAFQAIEELEIFGIKILDSVLNEIKALQGNVRINIKPQIKTQINLKAYFTHLKYVQEHYKGINLIQSRSEARQKYFQHGRIFKLIAALSEFKNKHINILTTGNFSLEDCLDALATTSQITRLIDETKLAEFSIITDMSLAYIKQLVSDFDNVDQLFPNLELYDYRLGITPKYYKKIQLLVSEIKKGLVLASIQCIDENLRKADIVICEGDCSSVAAIANKIPIGMQNERAALECIAKYIQDKDYTVAALYKLLLERVNNTIVRNRNINEISVYTNNKVERIGYYQQSLDKACYFSLGMCNGATRQLLNQNLSAATRAIPEEKSIQNISKLKYNDIHSVTVSAEIFELQRVHAELTSDFPQSIDSFSETHKIRSFGPELETLEEFAAFVASFLKDVDDYSQDAFNNGMQSGPRFYVNLLNNTTIGHTIGLQKNKKKSGGFFYRFIDYNAGEFLINGSESTVSWFAAYFSSMQYESYIRYQITINYVKTPTKQDELDFELRAKLVALFVEFDDAFCREDYNSILKEIVSTYHLIHNKHIYDHYAIWTRISSYLNHPFDITSVDLYKDAILFCHISLGLLEECKMHPSFEPMYKAHKFSALKDLLLLELRSKSGYKAAINHVHEIILILDFVLLDGAKENALNYFRSIADLETLKNFKDFKNLKTLADDISVLLYDQEYNSELRLTSDAYFALDKEVIDASLDTFFYRPASPFEYAFYYGSFFKPKNAVAPSELNTNVKAICNSNSTYMQPILNMFILSPERFLRLDEKMNSVKFCVFNTCPEEKTHTSTGKKLAICNVEDQVQNNKLANKLLI